MTDTPARATCTDRCEPSGMSVARGGRDVVRDVSIEIPPGEITALLGPNGAGKSSMVLAIGGVLRRAKRLGDARRPGLAGTPSGADPHGGMAIVPEGRRLLPELTVDENLRVATYALSARTGRGRTGARARAVPRAPEAAQRPGRASLSGGEQQMVVLAQALVSQPRFVIIDELSLGLAPVVVQPARSRRSARSPRRGRACC